MFHLTESLPDLTALGALYIFFLVVRHRKKNRTILMDTALFLSVVFILCATLMPFINHLNEVSYGNESQYNFIPFIDWIHKYGSYKEETVLNILLFIPFGFLHKLALHKPWWNTLLTGCLLSIMIEFIQPLISLTRVCDITDVITNTCGCGIGILFASVYLQKKI